MPRLLHRRVPADRAIRPRPDSGVELAHAAERTTAGVLPATQIRAQGCSALSGDRSRELSKPVALRGGRQQPRPRDPPASSGRPPSRSEPSLRSRVRAVPEASPALPRRAGSRGPGLPPPRLPAQRSSTGLAHSGPTVRPSRRRAHLQRVRHPGLPSRDRRRRCPGSDRPRGSEGGAAVNRHGTGAAQSRPRAR